MKIFSSKYLNNCLCQNGTQDSKLKHLTCNIKATKSELSDYLSYYETSTTNNMNVWTKPTIFNKESTKENQWKSSPGCKDAHHKL